MVNSPKQKKDSAKVAKNILNTKLLNIKKEKNQYFLKEEEDTMPNKVDLEDKKNLFSERKLKLLKRLY